jgi:PAS domain S-box-containing protein
VPAIVFLYLSWTTFLIDNHSQEALLINEWGYNSRPGEYFGIFIVWLESLMIASLVVLIKFYRTTTNYIKKKQVVLLIVAILIPLIFGSITDGVLPILDVHTVPSAVPLTTIMALIIGFAIMRYELFDFEALTIISSLGDGLMTVNSEGRIMNMNETAQKMINKDVRNLLNKKITTLLINENLENQKKLEYSIHRGKQLLSSDFVLKAKNKSTPVSVTVTPVVIEKKIEGATVLIKDIREEKKKEESKDEFNSIASHELKTPITSIKLYTDILSKKISPQRSEYVLIEKLKVQVDRLADLTNDLLDMSRIRTGSIQLHPEWFDISELTNEIVSTISKTEPERKIIIKGEIKKQVFADKNRIGQVVTNLITNALKYSSKNSKVIVTLNLKQTVVQISVQDFGQGVPSAFHNKIFQRFYRVNGTTTDQPSLGIGLYISATIVKEHNGKIWVKSNSNPSVANAKKGKSSGMKGSTFYVSIPLVYSQKR